MSEVKVHAVLALTHGLFEASEQSGLSLEEQITAAKMLGELLTGSQAGYAKVSIHAMAHGDAPRRCPANPPAQ